MVETLNPEKDTIPNAMWYNLSKTIFIKSKVDQTIIETNVRNETIVITHNWWGTPSLLSNFVFFSLLLIRWNFLYNFYFPRLIISRSFIELYCFSMTNPFVTHMIV